METADVTETTVDLRDRHGDDASEAVAATVIEQRGEDIVVRRAGAASPCSWRPPSSTCASSRHVRPRSTLQSGSATITARGTFGTTPITLGQRRRHRRDRRRLCPGAHRAAEGCGIDAVEGDLDVRSGSGGVEIGSVEGSRRRPERLRRPSPRDAAAPRCASRRAVVTCPRATLRIDAPRHHGLRATCASRRRRRGDVHVRGGVGRSPRRCAVRDVGLARRAHHQWSPVQRAALRLRRPRATRSGSGSVSRRRVATSSWSRASDV